MSQDRSDPRLIRFRPADDRGVSRPVTRARCVAFVLAALWVLGCGTVGMIGFALTQNPWWFVGMFAGGACGLAVFARLVARHS